MSSHQELIAPTSETTSLILHAHHACTYGKCSYCPNLHDIGREHFDIREFREYLAEESQRYIIEEIDSIFLAEGNTLSLDLRQVVDILRSLRQAFPFARSIAAYGNARSILTRRDRDFETMRREGLTRVHMGFESGSDAVLDILNKGISAGEMVNASRRLMDAGFELYLYLLVGAGGCDFSRQHVQETVRLINEIRPTAVECNTLVLVPHTPLHARMLKGEFQPLTPHQAIAETREIMTSLTAPLAFICNHISNFCHVGGRLPDEKNQMLRELDLCLSVGEEDYGKRGIVSIPLPA